MNPRQLLEQYYASRGTSIFEEDVKNLTNQGMNRPEAERRVRTGVNARDNALIAEEAERLGLISFQQKQQAYKETAGTGANLEAQGFTTNAQKEAEAQRLQQAQNIADAKLLGQPLVKPQQQQQQQQFLQPSQQFQPQQQTQQQPTSQNISQQPTGQQQLGQQQPQQPQTYTVRSGDTLSKIAAQFGVNWKTDISGFRSGNPDLIFPGEILTITKKFEPTPTQNLPQPEPTQTQPQIPPEEADPLTEVEEDYSQYLQTKTYDEIYEGLSQQVGLPSLQAQIAQLATKLEEVKQKGIKKREDINNNPWISESLRIRKIGNADRTSKEEESVALETFNLAQKQYDSARDEIKFMAKMQVDQQNEARDFYFKAKEASRKAREGTLRESLISAQTEAAQALATQRLAKIGEKPATEKKATQIINIDGKKYLVDKTTGNIIKEIKPGENITPTETQVVTKPLLGAGAPKGFKGVPFALPKTGFLTRVKSFFSKKKTTPQQQTAISPAGAISWDNF